MAKGSSLENNLLGISSIIEQLESGNLPLEESFKLYKEGVKLASQCSQQLDRIEKQIIILDNNEEDTDGN